MFKSIIQLFSKPTLLDMKKKMLLEAQTALLNAQAGLDFSKATVDYHNNVIIRLTADIAKDEGTDNVNVVDIHPLHRAFSK